MARLTVLHPVRFARLALAPGLLLVACVGGERGDSGPQVSGIVTYDDAFALPPDPLLAVALLDVAGEGAASVVAAETTVVEGGDLAFSLPYDPASIDPGHAYAVAARILDASGQVFFVSVGDTRVITGGAPTRVELPVLPAGVTGPLPPRAAQVAARIPSLERIDGQWEEGDAASAISAYFEGPQLRYLEERMTIGAYGSAASAYYFDQGALFFLETVKRVAAVAQGPDDVQEIAWRVLFAPDGAREEAMRWVNGAVAEMDEGELLSALRHAEGLREAALRLAASR